MPRKYYTMGSTDIITRIESTVDNNGYSLPFFDLECQAGVNHTSRAEEISKAITKRLLSFISPDTPEDKILLENVGLECEVLMVSNPAPGWQKGKVRAKVVLEFCPNEPDAAPPQRQQQPESVLDDLRNYRGN